MIQVHYPKFENDKAYKNVILHEYKNVYVQRESLISKYKSDVGIKAK